MTRGELTAGHLGVAGSYSHQALCMLCPEASYVGFPSFDLLVSSLMDGHVDLAILPMWNSTTGNIPQVHKALERLSEFQVVSEMVLPVHHALGGLDEALRVQDVEVIYSHPQGFLQCSEFIGRACLNAKMVEVSDTAQAVLSLKGQRAAFSKSAAISSKFAIELYGAACLMDQIQDDPSNSTRFNLISI
jgi:prephenate dehydratase